MALELAIIGIVAGAVLGLRFNVLALVPGIMFAMLAYVIVGVARADGVWSIILMAALLGVAIQVGYLAGAALHAVIEAIVAILTRGRNNHELRALGPAWPHTWRTRSWQLAPSAAVVRRRPQPPRI
jgi:hypothetical protein